LQTVRAETEKAADANEVDDAIPVTQPTVTKHHHYRYR